MEQATLNLVKFKKSKKKKKFNGFKTLYLINLKRLIRNKGILATSIMSIIITIIFSLLIAGFAKTPDNIMYIGLIMLSIGYIIQVFFFILFMIIISTELIKKQMLDGIQNIEIRSGMKFKSSFLLRWLVFITFVGGLWAINTLITILTSSTVLFKFDLISGIIFSTCIFYLFLTFFWTPIIFFITIICSIAWSVMLNIFISLILVFSGMISSFSMLSNHNQLNNNIMVMNLNLKLEIANSFYSTFKDDANINFIFDDLDQNNNQQSKFSNAINDNGSLKTKNINVTDFYYYNLISKKNIVEPKDISILEKSLYGGKPNLKYSYDNENLAVVPKNVLSGTEIFEKILNPIYQEILNGMNSNNKPPVSKPGYMGGFIERNKKTQGFHDLTPLTKWLSKQEDTKKYSSILNWVNTIYSKYSFSLTATRERGDSNVKSENNKPYVFVSKFTSNNQDDFDTEINTKANSVYKRYPELMIINDIITETWLNTMMSRTELYRNSNGSSTNSMFKQEEVYSNYQQWVNNSILKNNLNIFQHFSIMYGQLFGKAMNKDLIFSNSIFSYSGITTGFSNYEDLNKVDIRNRSDKDQNKPLESIFKDLKLKKKMGFSTSLAYLMYLLISFIMMYLVYLLWSRKSKI